MLVWQMRHSRGRIIITPLRDQPQSLADVQSDAHFPEGLRAAPTQPYERIPKPRAAPTDSRPKEPRPPPLSVAELLPLEQLVTEGQLSLVPKWAKGPGWRRLAGFRLACPQCDANLECFKRSKPKSIAIVCTSCRALWNKSEFDDSTRADLERAVKGTTPPTKKAKLVPTKYTCSECRRAKPAKAFPATNQRRCLNCGGQEKGTSVRTVSGGLVGRKR